MNSFNKELNPNLKNAEVELYVASKNDEIVGRIAVIINWYEVKEQKTSKIRFGWFDFIDDFEVSKVLLDKVVESGKKNKLLNIAAPLKLFAKKRARNNAKGNWIKSETKIIQKLFFRAFKKIPFLNKKA